MSKRLTPMEARAWPCCNRYISAGPAYADKTDHDGLRPRVELQLNNI
jgi:hypothetical protein